MVTKRTSSWTKPAKVYWPMLAILLPLRTKTPKLMRPVTSDISMPWGQLRKFWLPRDRRSARSSEIDTLSCCKQGAAPLLKYRGGFEKTVWRGHGIVDEHRGHFLWRFADRSLFHFRYLQNGESDLVEELVLRVGQTIQPMTMRCEHSGKPLQPGFHSCLCRPAARLSANTGNNATIGAPHR